MSIARTIDGRDCAILVHPDGTVVTGVGTGGGSTSVWSSSDAAANNVALTNGGLTATYSGAANLYVPVRTTANKSSGKLYIEFLNLTPGNVDRYGVASASTNVSVGLGSSNYSVGIGWGGNTVSAGFTSNYPVSLWAQAGMVISLAVDFTSGKIWIALNGVWSGADPATGTSPIVSFDPATVGPLFAAVGWQAAGASYTLQATAASQKYAPPSGFSAWDGGAAPSHSAEALAYLARTVGGNEGGNGANIATLIDGLVSDGVWAKLDALYVLAQQNQSDAQLNLVGTSYGLTGGLLAKPGPRALTFAPYVGFSGFANGLDSGFNPTTAVSPQYTLNSASLGYWAYSNIADDSPQVGIDNSSSEVYGHFTDGNAIISVNNSGFFRVASSITAGIIAGDRPDVANSYIYQNGIGGVSSGAASVSLYNGDFRIGLVTGGPPPTAQTISAAFIGASLGAAGQLALYNRLRTYMTAIGVP